MDLLSQATAYRFDDFLLDPRSRSLFRWNDGSMPAPIPLGARAFDILCVLIARRGEFVSKYDIMDVVWPGVVVEENNLTVQMSALRRVLDAERTGRSCIQTLPNRGYRFLPEVEPCGRPGSMETDTSPCRADGKSQNTSSPEKGQAPSANSISQAVTPRCRTRHVTRAAAAVLAVLIGPLLVWGSGYRSRVRPPIIQRPPLSVVVLPFKNLSGDPGDEYLADGITDDVTTELAQVRDAQVVPPQSAYAYRGKAVNMQTIGNELGVRYVLGGSTQKLSTSLRIDVQLTSTDTGTQLWSGRFDEPLDNLAAGQSRIVERLSDQLAISMVDIERTRSLRDHPTNPDAFDLILRARALEHLPQSKQRDKEALALYERALSLDPSSYRAMVGVAFFLVDGSVGGSDEAMQRAGRLLAQARSIAPHSLEVLDIYLYWLRETGHCPEVIAAAEEALAADPNRTRIHTTIYNELGVCKAFTGNAEEDMALQSRANQLNPLSPHRYSRFRHMGRDAALLGRNQDAITYLQQALALNPDGYVDAPYDLHVLAAVYARTGRMADARHALAEADRLWPYDTVRCHYPPYPSSTVYVGQIGRLQAALRLAGERDHADENANFGIRPSNSLHSEFAGYTPRKVAGAQTILTADLVSLLPETRPLVIDTVSYSWGRSIPGAVGLKFAGVGGHFDDTVQDRLRRKMLELTSGDLNKPIVAVGWNSERFDGCNLALRLVALGYTRVYWYRGGRETWEVNNQPETELVPIDW